METLHTYQPTESILRSIFTPTTNNPPRFDMLNAMTKMKNPLGKHTAQYHRMLLQLQTWLAAIKESSLSRSEAQAAFDTMWLPSLSYGLGTTNFTFKELDNIQKTVILHIIPSIGYNHHFPCAVVYGSPCFGGLAFKHLYIEQGIKHTMQFIKYYHHNNSIGQLLQISLRWI